MSESAKKALEALEKASKNMTEAELEYYTGRAEGYEAGFAKASDPSTEESEANEDAKT